MPHRAPYWLTPSARHKYPHLLPPETALLSQFIQAHAGSLQGAMYDVRVGEGVHPLDPTQLFALEISQALTTHRIDAVFLTATGILICEVKERAGLGAVGQLVGGACLFERDYRPDTPIGMLLITLRHEADLPHCLDIVGIRMWTPGQPPLRT